MSYKLFLDDDRFPIECVHWMYKRIGPRNPIYLEDDWVVVRTYHAFCQAIALRGLPSFVSFDHDLGKELERAALRAGMSKRQARRQKKLEKTGNHCAKILVEACIEQLVDLPEYAVHSMNEGGTENILATLRSGQKIIDSLKPKDHGKT